MLQLHPSPLLFRYVREPRHVISAAIFQHEHARFFSIGDRLFSQQDEFAASNLVCKLRKSDERPGATHRYKPTCPKKNQAVSLAPCLIFFHMSNFFTCRNFPTSRKIFHKSKFFHKSKIFHMSKIFTCRNHCALPPTYPGFGT